MGNASTLKGTIELSQSGLEFLKSTPFLSWHPDLTIYQYLWSPSYSKNRLTIEVSRNLYWNSELFNILATLKDIEGEDRLTLSGEGFQYCLIISIKPGYWKVSRGALLDPDGGESGGILEFDKWIKSTPLIKKFMVDHQAEEVIIILHDNNSYRIPFRIIHCELFATDFIESRYSSHTLEFGGAAISFPDFDDLEVEAESFIVIIPEDYQEK